MTVRVHSKTYEVQFTKSPDEIIVNDSEKTKADSFKIMLPWRIFDPAENFRVIRDGLELSAEESKKIAKAKNLVRF